MHTKAPGRLQRLFDTIYFPIASILASFLVAGVAFKLLGFDPAVAFGGLLSGSVGSLNAWGETLNKATPVILTGLSYAIAQRCGVINLGAEGQVYIGALCAVLVGTELSLPAALHIPVVLAAAFLGAALFGTLPAIMKNRFGSSELITTIMFNYVALYFVHYMIAGPIKDMNSGSNFAQSKQMLQTAQLPRLNAMFPGVTLPNRLHAGLIVAVLALIFYSFFLFRTTRGYEMRVIGLNRSAGECAGMNIRTNTLLSMFLAGGFAGLGGACELMGVQRRIMENAFNGFGFDGVAVALLGGNSSGGIALSGILFGALKSGATKMQMKSGVPTATVYMLQGLIILFVVGKRLFDYHRITERRKTHHGKEND
ncbi:MAG: ABC transporter permease [Clostridia bacterium]|nr:ABC transporter permease [Clostridia bacterium]